MRDLMTWLLVVNSFIAVAMVAYRDRFRPLGPMRISIAGTLRPPLVTLAGSSTRITIVALDEALGVA